MDDSGVNLNHFRVFYEVGKTGSFTAAAKVLGVTQPAVSMRVRALERMLGTTLCRTNRKQVVLTEAGRLLLDYAQRIFQLTEEAERQVRILRDTAAQTLRISTTKTIAAYFLPRVMGAFKDLHHGVSIRLDIGSNAWSTEAVLTGVTDLGLVVNALDHRDLERTLIFDDELVLLVPPDHPFAHRPPGGVPNLASETLILREPGSKTREVTESILQEAGIPIGQTMELADVEAIKSAVRAGLGLSLMASIAVHDEVQNGTIMAVPFMDGRVFLRFEAIRRRDRNSPVLEAFLQALTAIKAARSRQVARSARTSRSAQNTRHVASLPHVK